MNVNNSIRDTAVVVGAGIAGLLTAAALEPFFSVIVVEKDLLPESPQLRRSVPHGAHVHTLPAFACKSLDILLPGVVAKIYQLGAAKIRRNLDILYYDAGGPAIGEDSGLVTPSISQPYIEFAIRRKLMRSKRVRFLDQTKCLEFGLGRHDYIDSVMVRRNAQTETIATSFVAVCTGRGRDWTSRLLRSCNCRSSETDRLEVSMGYTSARFKYTPMSVNERKAVFSVSLPPSARAAYYTPIENGLWLATLFGRGDDLANPNLVGMLGWADGLAHPDISERLSSSNLVSTISSYRFKHASWARHERNMSLPENLVILGEAYASLNPMYGQGISMAASQALNLREVLLEGFDSEYQKISKNYFGKSTAFIEMCWHSMQIRDFAYPTTIGQKPQGIEDEWLFEKALIQAAAKNKDIFILKTRVNQLLEHPNVFRQKLHSKRIKQYL